MMATETRARERANGTGDGGAVVIRDETIAAFAAMASDIPESGGDGMEGIIAQLLQAEDATDLDAPWRADGLTAYLGRRLRIDGLRRMPSEFDGGLPFFLIVEAADLETGEKVTLTTGAVSVVAQLVKAWDLGSIPGWRVIPRQAERASSSGYYPQHLEVMRGRLATES